MPRITECQLGNAVLAILADRPRGEATVEVLKRGVWQITPAGRSHIAAAV
jgi:hypothetical protein